MESGQGRRIVQPIKRRNEDGSVNDLTREWMNEALFYPFALKRDPIDLILLAAGISLFDP